MPDEVKQEMKKCPACAELILAEAKKCKHCGERLDGAAPFSSGISSPVAGKGPGPLGRLVARSVEFIKAHRKVALAVSVAAVALSVVLLAGVRITNSDSWVALHRDVRWHRAWQDEHRENEAERLASIYGRLKSEHPNDPDFLYLSIRALPVGAERDAAFDEAAAKFPKHGWLAWAAASTQVNPEQEAAALELFGESPPPELVAGLLNDASAKGRHKMFYVVPWDIIKSVYIKHKKLVNGDANCSIAMALVEFNRGNLDGAMKWEDRALSLGHKQKTPDVFKKTIAGIRALGVRHDIIGATGRFMGTADALGGSMTAAMNEFEIFDFDAVLMSGGGYDITFRVYLNNDSRFPISWSNGLTLETSEGVKEAEYKMGTDGVEPYSQKKTFFRFLVGPGTRVTGLRWDTSLRWFGQRVVSTASLASRSAEAPVEGAIFPD